ncbi:GGDEF domain-containing protein [Herbaspirillum rhizosphaerae]|uniref:GGDEF domain-containing protein n=1 Tax=Herbaspirillum rhizosphaerae TaxID=346179 RepID=UPI00067D69FD|nr:sensor domain-containing diguanylate cyclase [Herbaspirillum rhizosphaerae]
MAVVRTDVSDKHGFGIGLSGGAGATVSLCLPGHPMSEPDERLGRLLWNITSLAGLLCDAPIAMVSQLQGEFDCSERGALTMTAAVALDSGVDRRRQWWRFAGQSSVVCSTADFSLCETAVTTPDRITEIGDLNLDSRCADLTMRKIVPEARFYAAIPLSDQHGELIGTLCVLDRTPRRLTPHQRDGLRLLAQQFMEQLEMHRDMQQLQRQTLTDALTGVGNRRGFDRRLHEEWSRHIRSGAALSLLMIDVDKFKQYNDAYGHPAGDVILNLLCELLRMPLRASDFVARYGGDEFSIILPNTPQAGAQLVVDRIQTMLTTAQWPNGMVTVSVGIATLEPEEACDFATLLARADQAMYLCKRSRREADKRD